MPIRRLKEESSEKERGLEGDEMAAPHHLPKGVIGGRKVRAPQGRVVRNADSSVSQEAEDGKCHRKDTACPVLRGVLRDE